MLNTPVALMIFNRPDLTKVVFHAVRKVKPKKLLIIADGPRFPEEEEKCRQAQAIVSKIDWDCEVFKNYSVTNLGCKDRVSSGLNWVFDRVEEAIILEDDCLPDSSFFGFCQQLLQEYRDTEEVMHIGGTNVLPDPRLKDSFFFSKNFYIWGWQLGVVLGHSMIFK